MESVKDVDIDSGRFKYILIKVTDKSGSSKHIVRGYSWAGFHGDIMDKIEIELNALKLAHDCVGGGRIVHHPDEKTILVFGYSQGFGKADHSITCELLKTHYPDYKQIDWSNEGY